MSRARSSVSRKAAHKKILAKAKGYSGARSRSFRVAKQAVIKAGQYSYRDRRQRRRMFRSLWIARLNAAARLHDIKYSQLIHGLKLANIDLDRKTLSDLAIHDEDGFAQIVSKVKSALA